MNPLGIPARGGHVTSRHSGARTSSRWAGRTRPRCRAGRAAASSRTPRCPQTRSCCPQPFWNT
uniref:Uncharacterized protein n=1 Tax=Anguilla anguilla TaxID=7936 RepID=A0A0E9PFW6_ANGAN